MNNVEYNFSLLSEKISALMGAVGGDSKRALMTETGQLAGRIGDAIGPATLDKARKRVERDIKEVLTIFPMYSNLDEEQQYSSTSDFTWLAAGARSLMGINDEDNQVNASGKEALELLRAGQANPRTGGRYEILGQRGKQSVQRVNRVRVSKAAYNYVRNSIIQKTGELRACFYRVALHYVPTRRMPGWIMARIEQVQANGKSTLNEAALGSPMEPFIEFTVRAPGVVSNPQLAAKINGGIKGALASLTSKLKKILAGQAYNFNTGAVFRPTAIETET